MIKVMMMMTMMMWLGTKNEEAPFVHHSLDGSGAASGKPGTLSWFWRHLRGAC